eukprot:11464309-Alexandrium_andersonii.AAC.1
MATCTPPSSGLPDSSRFRLTVTVWVRQDMAMAPRRHCAVRGTSQKEHTGPAGTPMTSIGMLGA